MVGETLERIRKWNESNRWKHFDSPFLIFYFISCVHPFLSSIPNKGLVTFSSSVIVNAIYWQTNKREKNNENKRKGSHIFFYFWLDSSCICAFYIHCKVAVVQGVHWRDAPMTGWWLCIIQMATITNIRLTNQRFEIVRIGQNIKPSCHAY